MQQDFGPFLRLPRSAGCTRKHTLRNDINIEQFDAVVGENKLANLVGMRHATGLQHPDTTVAFAVAFNTAQENPCVHQRRNADLGLLEGTSSLREAGKKSSNLVRFEKIYQAGQHRLN